MSPSHPHHVITGLLARRAAARIADKPGPYTDREYAADLAVATKQSLATRNLIFRLP